MHALLERTFLHMQVPMSDTFVLMKVKKDSKQFLKIFGKLNPKL